MDTENHNKIISIISSLSEAWGHNDAEAYAKHFSDNAIYITYMGTCYQGRQEICKSHRALFSKFLKGTQLAYKITGVRFLGEDTAVVTTRGDTYTDKPPRKLTKVQTYTLVREPDGQWEIDVFQNTKRKRWMEFITFKLLPDTVPS